MTAQRTIQADKPSGAHDGGASPSSRRAASVGRHLRPGSGSVAFVAALVIAASPLVHAGRAAAQAPPPAQTVNSAAGRARHHNAVAKKLFNLGLFDQAAEEYTRAYQAKPVPAFLFNLAQCYKRMTTASHLRRSVFYFKSYLQNDPYSPMRADVEQELGRLERRIEELERPSPIYKRWWFWTAVGVAVAGAAVGTALALQPEDQQPAAVSLDTFVVGR